MLNSNIAKGLTLIELLLTIAILGVISCFSLPFLSSFYQKNQLQVVENEIKSAIRLAKTQALIGGHNILLAPLSNTTNWSQGLVLCIDNVKHQCVPDALPRQEWPWQLNGIEVMWSGFQSKRYLVFSADALKNAVNGYFLIQDTGRSVLKLTVNRLGRVRIQAIILKKMSYFHHRWSLLKG